MRKPAAVLFVLSLAVLALALVPAAGLAAKGGNGGGGGGHGGGGGGSKPGGGGSTASSLAVVMVTDTNGNGSPNWGDTITFNISTTQTTNPYVELHCYQNGTLVYTAYAGFYPDYPWPGSQLMPLSSPSWTGGAADCTATLNTSLATLNFHVDG
jgi:hypothetical protein